MRDHDSDPSRGDDEVATTPEAAPFDPSRVAITRILAMPPSLRDAAIAALQQHYGTAYVQRMMAAPAPELAPHPMLREGSSGASVIELQQKLDNAGGTLATDGVFGRLTRTEVVRFQTGNQLSPDGIVGPLTWAALDHQTTSGPAELAIGDAEGGTTTSDGLQTLDPSGAQPGTGGNDFGFAPTTKGKGKLPVAPVRPPPVQDANKAGLLAGAFADRGAYAPTQTGFAVPELDQLLGEYGAFWSVDVRAIPAPDRDAGKTGAGDSAGKGVSTQPPWVKALQNKIIARSKWDDDDRATQRLIEAYLRAWTAAMTNGLPPGAEQLFHQVGASETNGQAGVLDGDKGASNWCAAASQKALVIGMYNRGIRFKTPKHFPSFGPELSHQMGAYVSWAHQPGHVTSGKSAWTAELQPGDIISVINGGAEGPLSGHVATVVSVNGDQIVYVSGNAAGVVNQEGAVRIEEVHREQPPPDYDWMTIATRGNAYDAVKQREKKAGERQDKDTALIRADIDWIQQHTAKQLPSVDVNNKASIAALIAFLVQLPVDTADRAEMIAKAQEILTLQGDEVFAGGDLVTAEASEAMMNSTGTLPTSRHDPRFKPGVHAPAQPGSSWVVEVIRTGNLTKAQMLANGHVATVPNDPALEQGPTLQEQCPDTPADVINTSAQ